MFSIFQRTPKNCDEAFADLSVMLWQDDSKPTFRRETLDPEKFDFSLESLKHLDEYLEMVYQDQPDDETLMPIALRGGAYLGEVIKKHSEQNYHWYDFEQASKLSPMVKELGMSLGTAAVLAVDRENLCFPIAKIMKYLDNGSEDSTYLFGYIGINGSPEADIQHSHPKC
jgi:hypothetical protein